MLGVVAAMLVQAFLVLDLVDGNLARVSKRSSAFGYWFDTTVDTAHEMTLIGGLGIGTIVETGNLWFALPAIIWLVSSTVNHNNNLVETAAGITLETRTGPIDQSRTIIARLLRRARTTRWAIGQPEIMNLIIAVGLFIAAKEWLIVFFAVYSGYSTLRLFHRQYSRYRSGSTDLN